MRGGVFGALGWLAASAGCAKPTEPTAPPVEPTAPSPEVETTGTDPREPDVATAVDVEAANDPDIETLSFSGVDFKLVSSKCVLSATYLGAERTHHFDFPGPCHWSPDRDGQPWIVTTDHGKAVLVESWTSTDGGNCDTALQVVVVSDKGPELSSQVQRVSRCGPGPWDEMMYHVMSGQRVGFTAE